MEEKLVTLAIRTYKRAQMIKAELEKNGIETVIHNLNLEHPEMAVGVRVRIKETDLPKALSIVEEKESIWEQEEAAKLPPKGQLVLMPIDLTDNVKEICRYGFMMAKNMHAEVKFLHAYFTPAFSISTNNDINTYSLADNEMIRKMLVSINADVENLTKLIHTWIDEKYLPKVKFSFELKEGVPEDEIISFCKKEKVQLIIMGTQSKNKKHTESIGSVTAEVLESSCAPVIAVPEHGKYKLPDEINKIAFLTNFDQKDLIAIDMAIKMFKNNPLQIYFLHFSQKKETWNDIMLTGIKGYFEKNYPGLQTEYAILKKDEDLKQIQNYLKSNQIDIVAMNTKKRNLFARFFHQGIVTRMLFNVDTPLLVMHL